MDALNSFELVILNEIVNSNSDKNPWLINHLNIVGVKNRKYTGVGLYTNFEYSRKLKENNLAHTFYSSEKILRIPSLKYSLVYELSILKVLLISWRW